MSLGRRTFLVGSAACLACAACSDDADEATSASSTTDRDSDRPSTGFGSRIDVGSFEDVLAEIDAGDGFRYVPEARAYLVRYPADALETARSVYDPETLAGMEAGLVALYQKCPHLGCRVPECTSSGRFECPCHGVFNAVGEYVAGPAPRGLDRFGVGVADGRVWIDSSVPLEGLAIGISTVDGDPVGPSCIPLEG